MRQTRVYIGVLLLVLGLLGAYLGAVAQEVKTPWPPPPVKIPPQSDYGDANPPGLIQIQATRVEPLENHGEPPLPIFPNDNGQSKPSGATDNEPGPIGPMLSGPSITGTEPAPKANEVIEIISPKDNSTKPTIQGNGPTSSGEKAIGNAAPELADPPGPPRSSGPAPVGPVTPRPIKNVEPVATPRVRVAVPIRRNYHAPEPLPNPSEVISKSAGNPEPSLPPRALIPLPLLTLEKRGPVSVLLGQPVHYEIVVHNVGSVAAPQVRVEDTLPDGVRFLGGSPQPVLQGGRVVWILDQVLAGSEQRLQLDLQPTAAGDLSSQTSLILSVGSNTEIAPAPMALTVSGPARVSLGKPAVFEVKLANNSKQRLNGLILYAQLSPGLTHPMGATFEGDLGDMVPGASKNITLATTGSQLGRQEIEIRIIGKDREEARTQASVFVGEAGLIVNAPEAARIVLDRPGELNIDIANFHTKTARNVAIAVTLPDGVEFLGASERGLYRSVTRTVHWVLDALTPEQTRTLRVKVKGKTSGQFAYNVSARASEGLKAQAQGKIVVEGMAQLTLNITDRDDPLEVGRETVYEIRVKNEGSAADAAVKLLVTLPEGMSPRNASGPSANHIQGQQVVFEPLARLDGRQEVVFRVGALAQTAGDRRLRVQLTSNQSRSPITREERTLVYRD